MTTELIDQKEKTYDKIVFQDEDLNLIDFAGSTYKNCTFTNCTYTECSFFQVIFDNCFFVNCNFSFCYAQELEIQGGSMVDCSLHLINPSMMVLEIHQTDTLFNFSC